MAEDSVFGSPNKRPATDEPMDGTKRGKPGDWWRENSDLTKFEGPYLYEATKLLVGQVFLLMDSDGDGSITPEDFEKLTHHQGTAMRKWEDLRQEFSSESEITPRDFVIGVKRLAWKKAVDPTCFASDAGANYSRFMISLNEAVNTSMKRTLRELLSAMVIYTGETVDKMREAWAAIDFDKDGHITKVRTAELSHLECPLHALHAHDLPTRDLSPHDLPTRPQADFQRPGAGEAALAYFNGLAAMCDADGDGTITQAEFEAGLKSYAIDNIDGSILVGFTSAAAAAATEPRLPRFMTAVNANLVATCKNIVSAMK